MPWQRQIYRLIGKPVGLSLRNGKGVSGVLCDVRNGVVYLQEYMYQDQFALKKYRFESIDNVYSFPNCTRRNPFTPRVY